jgi:hypothetical protein
MTDPAIITNPSTLIAELEHITAERLRLSEAGSATPSSPAKIRAAASFMVRADAAHTPLVDWYRRWKRDPTALATPAEATAITSLVLAELTPTSKEQGKMRRLVLSEGLASDEAQARILAKRPIVAAATPKTPGRLSLRDFTPRESGRAEALMGRRGITWEEARDLVLAERARVTT